MLLLCSTIPGTADGPPHTSTEVALLYHSRIPLGTQSFAVDAWNSPLTLLALALNPQFEGWRRETQGARYVLVDARGAPVRYFPEAVDFRVSASTRLHLNDDPPVYPLHTKLAPEDYLLQLRFQLKIFHGLHQTTLRPAIAELIGVPADLPYPDRIYHLRFLLPHVPTSDRIVLEVLAPNGERICKFHLDLS